MRHCSTLAAARAAVFSVLLKHTETGSEPAAAVSLHAGCTRRAQPSGGGGGSAAGAAAAAAWPPGWGCQLAAGRLGGVGGGLRAPSGDPRASRSQIVAAAGHLTVRCWGRQTLATSGIRRGDFAETGDAIWRPAICDVAARPRPRSAPSQPPTAGRAPAERHSQKSDQFESSQIHI